MISLGFGHGWNNTNSIDDQHSIKSMLKEAIYQLPMMLYEFSIKIHVLGT